MGQDFSGYNEGYYNRAADEYWFRKQNLLRSDELAALSYAFGRTFFYPNPLGGERTPKHIVSIGCGVGYLEATLERMGVQVTGVDPSPGAKALYMGTTLIDRYEGGGDTIMFVESLEHIPIEEIRRILSVAPSTAMIIVTNWPGFFPIVGDPNGWDHITTVNDALFDEMAVGRVEVLRKDGHLILGPA